MSIILPRPYPYHSLAANEYLGVHDRRAIFAGVTEGVLGPDELEVSPTSPASLEVSVAAGRAYIQGDAVARQGLYFAELAVADTIAVDTPDGSLPRIDLLVLEDLDSSPDGGSAAEDEQRIRFVTGTPASSPAVPALPDGAVPLAEVAVAAGATELGAGAITDARPIARAALALPDGSVDTTALADDAVTGEKLAAGAVGAAALADDAVTASALADGAVGEDALEATATTAITLANGWANLGGGHQVAQAQRDATGRVFLRGVIAPGSSVNIGFVPAGFRPASTELFPAGTGDGGGNLFGAITVRVATDGLITANSDASPFSLSGITYRAA